MTTETYPIDYPAYQVRLRGVTFANCFNCGVQTEVAPSLPPFLPLSLSLSLSVFLIRYTNNQVLRTSFIIFHQTAGSSRLFSPPSLNLASAFHQTRRLKDLRN